MVTINEQRRPVVLANAGSASRRFKRMCLACLLCICAPHAVQAVPPAVRCVTNTAQLASALSDAATAPLTIKLEQHAYDLRQTGVVTQPPFRRIFILGGTSVLGGYIAATSCASRNIEAGNTVLADSDANEIPIFEPSGDFTLEGITVRPKGGMYIGQSDPFNSATLNIRRNVFSDANGPFSAMTIEWGENTDGTINIADNLFTGNASQGMNSCALDLHYDVIESGSRSYVLVNNTVVDNSTYCGVRFGFGSDENETASALKAYNNIIYGNGTLDLVVIPATIPAKITLHNNIIGTHDYPAAVSPVAQLSGDPGLDANFRPVASPQSPAINTGTANVPGGLPASDLDGGERVIGSAPDRGAYESGVNDLAIGQVVSNTNDSGPGSLRQAIADANSAVVPIITFDIGTACGPHVIEVTSNPLPKILKPMFINGYTQPGSSKNTLDTGWDASICIIVEDNGSFGRGLQVAADAPGGTSGAHLQLTGIALSGFGTAAIDLEANDGHEIYGNQFGGFVGSTALQPNGVNIRVGGSASGASVGGNDPSNRNLINSATGNGIEVLDGSHDDDISGNYIGVGWGGDYTQRGNGAKGIYVNGHDNTIDGNLIGNSADDGIDIDGINAGALSVSYNNVISNNAIGVSRDDTDLGNGSMGVRIDSARDNTIVSNTIAYNDQKGVRVVSGTGNGISKNAIYHNALLGIDLGSEGVTPNDDDSTATAWLSNRGQNFPVLTLAIGTPLSGTFRGTLTTTPGTYSIELFSSPVCDIAGNGEGRTWRKKFSVVVPTPASGNQGTVAFETTHAASLSMADTQITATATDADGNTSEFSVCIPYEDDTVFSDDFE